MTKIKAQLEKIKAKSRVEVLAQLTEEQKLLFSEKKHKRGQAFKEGKRQGRPEGRNKEFMPF